MSFTNRLGLLGPADRPRREHANAGTPAGVPRGRRPDRSARGRGAVGRLAADKRGAAAILAAVATTSLLGVTGLAVEVGSWYLLRRNMQAAVDAASMAGAVNLDAGNSTTAVRTVALSVAARNGFADGVNGTTVTVSPDPGTGRVEVAVERPSSSVLLRAAGVQDSAKVVRARAVARVVEAGAKPCVHALAGSVSVGNNTNITASDCSLVSDMSSPDAFKVGSGGSMANGSGRITAASIITHGGCQGCVEALGNTKLTLTRSTSPTTYAPKTSNPYENLNNWSPPYSGSNQNCPSMPSPRQGGSSVTVSPACFNAMRVGSGTTVDLQPGVYYVQGGNLDVQGNLTCTACGNDNGVSIVLVGRGNSAPGRVDVNAQARIDLHAGKQPSEPRLDGVLIYRHAPDAQPSQNGRGEIDINGGATMKLNGAIVAPTSWVTMAGSGATDPNACNVFIVHSMEFRGNTGLSAEGCHFYGTDAGMPRIPRLVE